MCGFQGTRNRRWSARCAESLQDGSSGYEVTERKPRRRRTAQTLHSFPVTMAKGIHLFPYRTQKLSLSAPMVLGWRRPGRVGRCRIPWKKDSPLTGWVLFSFHLQRSYSLVVSDERPTLLWRSTFHVTKGAYMGKNGITRDRTGKPWYYRNSKR